MAEYMWHGPVQGVTLADKSKAVDVILIPGNSYHLPEKHPTVRGLIASGLAQPILKKPKEEPSNV